MIKAIIFDIGGVLITEGFYKIIERLATEHGIDPADLRTFIRPLFHDGVMRGEITETQMWQQVIDHFHLPLQAEGLHEKLSLTVYSRIEKVWDYVQQLTGKYELAILSNLGLESLAIREMTEGMSSHFNVIVYSAQVGMRKPDAEIYHHILDLLKLPADECIFIDNKEENVVAANEVGIHGILFTDPDKLKEDLGGLGVIVN